MSAAADWMLRSGDSLESAAAGLRRAAAGLQQVEAQLRRLLADSAATLGWRGDAADAAAARQQRHGTQLDRAAEALTDAATALADLGRALDAGAPRLRRLLDERETLLRLTAVERLLPLALQVIDQVLRTRREELRDVEAQIRAQVAELRDADGQARARLERAVRELRDVGAEAAGDGWLGTATSLDVRSVLGRYGVVDDRQDNALLDWAAGLPRDAAGTAELRRRLAELSPEQVAELLLRHPGLAQRLTGGLPEHPPVGSPEAQLAAALAHDDPRQRIAAVTAAFARLTPAQQRMLALLYPALVGRLDGAPLDARFAANRVQIAAALQRERDIALAVDRAVRDRSGVEQWREQMNDKLGLVVDVEDLESLQARNADRIAYYQQLLYEEVVNPAPAEGRPVQAQHQILYFDPAGDGTIAEMWGAIDEHTRNIAVFVPGTTADMENFAGYADKMATLAREDTTGGTTTIAWLGVDMPDAVGRDAPNPSYSLAGGPALRDFVSGLAAPSRVATTVIGHSYGGAVVGVADREGLDVDRILHIESAGAGRDVRSIDDYPGGRDVRRYTMQAPGDPIALSQGRQVGAVGHGADVNELPGITRLETGRYGADHPEHPGEMISGPRSHSDVLVPQTTAWENMVGVVTGTTVTPWSPPTQSWSYPRLGPITVPRRHTSYPYADPDYPGLPPVPVE